jgi:2,5-diketo-D-gluconate reductase B
MLRDGPRLGFGTGGMRTRAVCVTAVETALEAGYRHVDTAAAYGNESFVGEAITAADVSREDLFVATKVWDDSLAPADVVASAEASCQRLGLDTLDLLYVHWPRDTYDPARTLPAFDGLYDRGVIEAVGLSNFTPALVEEALEILDAPVLAHQVEQSPLVPQRELRELAVTHDHWLVAYAPLGRGAALELPEVRAVAEKHRITPAQAVLAWQLSLDHVATIPKAASPEHVRENIAARDVHLDEADIARIGSVDDSRRRRTVDPDDAPWRTAERD